MSFTNDDDDADFLRTNTSGSKLASLFGDMEDQGSSSLTYTAPKEPKKKSAAANSEESVTKTANPGLICVATVTAFKFVDSQYVSQGRAGAALITNTDFTDFTLLLYVTKQKPLTSVKISNIFPFTVQDNHYAIFYDDVPHTWSILFESAASLEKFAQSVALAKAALIGPQGTLLQQDLTYASDTERVKVGDAVELSYQCWVVEACTLSKAVKAKVDADKPLRFKVGKGKVLKCFDDGVVGMCKNGKRFLVCSPAAWKGAEKLLNVPANSTLAFELLVTRVKGKEKEGVKDGLMSQQETDTEGVTADDEDKKEENTMSRAKLLSRIAKMGQNILPVTSDKGGTSGQGDSEDEEEETKAKPYPVAHPKPKVASKPHLVPHQTPSPPVASEPVFSHPAGLAGYHNYSSFPQQQMAVYQSAQQMAALQQQQMYPGALSHYATMIPPVPQYTGAAPNLVQASSTELTETRLNTSQLVLTVNKVDEKLTRLVDKVESLHQTHQQTPAATFPSMETGVLLHNIQRIVQENERLKSDIFEKSGKIEEQNQKIQDLIQRNQLLIEQSNSMLEQRSDKFRSSATESQGRVLTLEQEKVQLTTQLSQLLSQLSTLQLEAAELRRRDIEKSDQLASVKKKAEELDIQLTTMTNTNSDSTSQVQQLMTQVKEEKRRTSQLENDFRLAKEEAQSLGTKCTHLEKALEKKKEEWANEKLELENELHELRNSSKTKIQTLQEQLKKEKSSVDLITAEQVAKAEDDVMAAWKAKHDMLMANAENKTQRTVQELEERHARVLASEKAAHAKIVNTLKEEREEMEEKINEFKQQLSLLKKSQVGNDDEKSALLEKVEELQVWRQKYERVRSQAASMRQSLEGKLTAIEAEIEAERQRRQQVIDKAKTLHQQQLETIARLEQQLEAEKSLPQPAASADITQQVKNIMSKVYSSVRSEVKVNQQYEGQTIHSIMLNLIKSVTLSMLSPMSQQKDEDEDSADEEDSSDEDTEQTPASSSITKDQATSVQPTLFSTDSSQPSNELPHRESNQPPSSTDSSQPSNELPHKASNQPLSSTDSSKPPTSEPQHTGHRDQQGLDSTITADEAGPVDIVDTLKVEDSVGSLNESQRDDDGKLQDNIARNQEVLRTLGPTEVEPCSGVMLETGRIIPEDAKSTRHTEPTAVDDTEGELEQHSLNFPRDEIQGGLAIESGMNAEHVETSSASIVQKDGIVEVLQVKGYITAGDHPTEDMHGKDEPTVTESTLEGLKSEEKERVDCDRNDLGGQERLPGGEKSNEKEGIDGGDSVEQGRLREAANSDEDEDSGNDLFASVATANNVQQLTNVLPTPINDIDKNNDAITDKNADENLFIPYGNFPADSDKQEEHNGTKGQNNSKLEEMVVEEEEDSDLFDSAIATRNDISQGTNGVTGDEGMDKTDQDGDKDLFLPPSKASIGDDSDSNNVDPFQMEPPAMTVSSEHPSIPTVPDDTVKDPLFGSSPVTEDPLFGVAVSKTPTVKKSEEKKPPAGKSSLFGTDDSDDDSDLFLPRSGQEPKPQVTQKKAMDISTDDPTKPAPPPLFPDEDEDDDLDWFK